MVNVAAHSASFLEILYRPHYVAALKFKNNNLAALFYGAKFAFTGILCIFLFARENIGMKDKLYVAFIFGAEIAFAAVIFLLIELIFFGHSKRFFVGKSIGLCRVFGIFSVVYGACLTTISLLICLSTRIGISSSVFTFLYVIIALYAVFYVGPQMFKAFYDIRLFKLMLCVFFSFTVGGFCALALLAGAKVI